jgi:hypothetical protein
MSATSTRLIACMAKGRYYMDPKGPIVLDKYPSEWEAVAPGADKWRAI